LINGSPRKGNSWLLAEQIRSEIASLLPDSIFEEIHIMDLISPKQRNQFYQHRAEGLISIFSRV